MISLLGLFDFHPLITPALTLPVCLLLVAVTVWVYLRHTSTSPLIKLTILGLRLCAITLTTLLLLGPQWYETAANQEEPPRLTVLLDLSQSMNKPVSDNDAATRLQSLQQDWLARQDVINRAPSWHWLAMKDHLQPLNPDEIQTLEASASSSPILEHLQKALRQSAVGHSFVLASDGADTSDPLLWSSVIHEAKTRKIQIHTIATGRASSQAQLQLQFWPERTMVYDGESTELHVQLQYHALAQGNWTLELIRNTEVIDQQSLNVNQSSGDLRLSFPVSPALTPGESQTLHHYQLRLKGPDGKENDLSLPLTSTNTFITVTGQRIRALLLEGSPHWDSSFLVRSLAQDPRVDMTTAIAYSQWHTAVQHYHPDHETDPQDSSAEDILNLDLSAEGLSQYDVVLLGRGLERFFPRDESEKLVDYVKSGGALFLIRGEAFPDDQIANERLNRILPLQWAGRIQKDVEIQRAINSDRLLPEQTKVKLTRLPLLTAIYDQQQLKENALIFLDTSLNQKAGTSRAALVAGPYEKGRVMTWLTQNSWRWAFMNPEQDHLRAVHDSLHRNAMRWLAYGDELTPQDQLTLSATPTQADLKQTIKIQVHSRWQPASELPLDQIELWLADETGEKRLQQLPLKPDESAPNHLISQWASATPGIYRLQLIDRRQGSKTDASAISQELPIIVSDQSPDHLIHQARPQWLQQLSASTQGLHMDIQDLETFMDALESSLDKQRLNTIKSSTRPTPWIHWFPISLAILTCFSVEWFMRRRSGLN